MRRGGDGSGASGDTEGVIAVVQFLPQWKNTQTGVWGGYVTFFIFWLS